MSYVTRERGGRVAVKALSLTGIGVCVESSWDVSVRYGVTRAALSPRSEKLATWRRWALFRTTTAVDPSLFWNALTSRPVRLVVVSMRTAPGRTKRL
jgi:hypothetical protein